MATLSGIRVLDFCGGLAGPSATRMLASLGAEVIKLETPGTGEFTRQVVPYVFRSHNRDKRSVAIDVKSPAGAGAVRRLAARCDVFVQSQRPGLADTLGLGRADLTKANPRLIYASLSGFGSAGTDSQRRAVDMLIQAESGLAAAQGRLLGNLSFVDSAAGLALASGILAALVQRAVSGGVEHVECSLLDTAVYLQAAPFAEFSARGTFIDQDSYWQRYATVGTFDAADGPVYMAAYWNRDWAALCDLFGRPELAADPRYATSAARAENHADVRSLISAAFAERARAGLVTDLEARGIMAGQVRSYADVMRSPQVAANQSFEEDAGETAGGRTLFARPPFRLTSGEPLPSNPAPEVGADTLAVLREAGLTATELSGLLAAGAVGGPVPQAAS